MRRITIYAIKINWSQSISSPSFHMHTSQQKVSPLADTSLMEHVGKCSSNRSTMKFLGLCAWFRSSFVTQLKNFLIWNCFRNDFRWKFQRKIELNANQQRIQCSFAISTHGFSWLEIKDRIKFEYPTVILRAHEDKDEPTDGCARVAAELSDLIS